MGMKTVNWSHNTTRCVAGARRSISKLSAFEVEIWPIHMNGDVGSGRACMQTNVVRYLKQEIRCETKRKNKI